MSRRLGLVLLVLAPAVVVVRCGGSSSHLASPYALEMRAALRRVAAAESSAWASTGRYTVDLAALGDAVTDNGPDVRIAIDHADSAGWRATARYDLVTQTCRIEVRRAGGRGTAAQPSCDNSVKFTGVADSAFAGLAPRRGFERWIHER